MSDGYWVISVDRETGHATSELIMNADEAWQRSIDSETPATYTTVVPRRIGSNRKKP